MLASDVDLSDEPVRIIAPPLDLSAMGIAALRGSRGALSVGRTLGEALQAVWTTARGVGDYAVGAGGEDAMTNDGGPAFPHARVRVDGVCIAGETKMDGMSLRDYFAAKAMHAELLSAGSFEGPARALADAARLANRSIEEQIVFNAYMVADAMLAEREREK